MKAKKLLTDFSAGPISPPELTRMLDEAGLELWQAPEGFWAVRIKPVAAQATQPKRARRAR